LSQALSRFGQVELISESNFDIEALMKYFGHRSAYVRKRIVAHFCTEVTRDYDIFVNSCFLNETVSLAKQSYYLVSFPSRSPPKDFLSSYYFMANSKYTLNCMKNFWGETAFRGEVLHPCAPAAFFLTPQEKEKARKKTILSVGRFVATGHIKNQLEIIQAFRAFVTSAPDSAKGWSLVLAGSVNDPNYLSQARAACEGLDVTLATEASFEDIRRFYREASIYVHASGYGRDPATQPELFEHFGIAVAQALASGCVPLVFDAAGPKEIVEAAGVGKTWRTLDDLVEALRENADLRSSRLPGEDLLQRAAAAAERYSATRLANRVNRLALYGS
jgi:glycosyltransferase involved in cell wall biosynthesis